MKLQNRKKKGKTERNKKVPCYSRRIHCASKIMPHQHQGSLYPNAQRCEYVSFHSKRVMKDANKIKVANYLNLG